MKNITLSVDDKILLKVRRYAAERGTTVNGIVRDHLTRIAMHEDKAAKARRELAEIAKRSTLDPGPDWKWNREELHDRPQLPRHKYSDLRRDRGGS